MTIKEVLSQYEIMTVDLEMALQIEGHPPGYMPKSIADSSLPDIPAHTVYGSREKAQIGVLEHLERIGVFQLQFTT